MLKCFFLIAALCFSLCYAEGQTIEKKLASAYATFENDSQLKHAISSLYVINAKTGKVVFEKNAYKGLAPASTQKIITSATAFEFLGKDYKFKTEFDGEPIQGNNSLISLTIRGFGDPTLGSFRFYQTQEKQFFNAFFNRLKKKNISRINNIQILRSPYDSRAIPSGWIYEDVGNYYGAGIFGLNWRENQYDLVLIPGDDEGDVVQIDSTNPKLPFFSFSNFCETGKPGSGDNAYIYAYPGSTNGILKGTVPAGEKRFTISGAITDPACTFSYLLMEEAIKRGMAVDGPGKTCSTVEGELRDVVNNNNALYIHYSPAFDSMNYFFLKRSINLYGEAFIKALAFEKQGFGSTEKGLEILKNYWLQKGINVHELNMYDGSGLSPLNRVTTHAQVEVLKYAKKQSWFSSFYNALPEFNNMKMKSGSISDARAFCGYHNDYIFSFIINNYSGSSSSVVQKMYKVLDALK